MGTTAEQTITVDSEWNEVAAAVGAGTIQNIGTRSIRVQEGDSIPDSSDIGGHVLKPSKSLEYSLRGQSKLWIRATTADGTIAITQD